nr:hypothetical protein [Streptococcus ruminicola]
MTGHVSGGVPEKIIKLFIKSVFDVTSLSTQGIIIINLILLVAFIILGIRLKHKKGVFLAWLFIDVSIVTYYISILLMYLTAMPTDEALQLAGFERYASSMVIFAFGYMVMALAWVMDECLYEQILSKRNAKSYKTLLNKRLYQYATLVLAIYAVGMLLSENNSIVFNNNQETNKVSKELHKLTGNNMDSSKKRILVVTADKEHVDSFFVQYASRYYLWDVNVDARENFVQADKEFLELMKSYSNNATSYYLWNENIEARDDFTFTDKDFIAMLKTYDEVVILDDHYTFNALTKKLFGRTYAPGVYKTSDKKRILVVTADKEHVDSFFVQYASRYYLWDVNVDARENFVQADKEFLELMKSYSNNATSYYLWNENIEARDDFTFTDKDFIAMLKTYDEVVILDDHYTFNALTKKLFGRTYAPGVYKTSDILAGKG